jgi:hypothetical protein
MDLSGFDEQRRGCAYEIGKIGKLVDEVPFERFVLLVNNETNMAFLRHTLHEAWLSKREGSPNSTAATDPHPQARRDGRSWAARDVLGLENTGDKTS